MISNRLKSLREEHGLSQKELASKLGVSPSTIGMYESEKRTPDSDMLKRIADFFNISVDYLLGRTNDKSKHVRISPLFQGAGTIGTDSILNYYPKNDKDYFNRVIGEFLNTTDKSEIEKFRQIRNVAMHMQDKELSDDEIEKVKEFIDFLASRKK